MTLREPEHHASKSCIEGYRSLITRKKLPLLAKLTVWRGIIARDSRFSGVVAQHFPVFEEHPDEADAIA
jgi:hypothetical protein